jgi:hypothetical protein
MAKQVVATMDIQHDGEKYPMGQPIDPKKFSKDQLTRLYERGAVRIEEAGAVKTAEPTMDDLNHEGELAPDSQ